ncbi:hypothetical protein EHS25_003053 [Saitozyma podzolica]|uniref:Protein YTP1-like C-terminal domain-containing protein n=1 Tax=Saitozyma podzolica TaxID=1890683 RepID=A0A427YCF9_9TREE|nr:hypothetical protein EHS25_003053 [Saitozyma podzolica]
MRNSRRRDVTPAVLTLAVALVGATVVGAAASSNGHASAQLQRRHDDDDHASGNHMHGSVADWDESEDDDGDALGVAMDMDMNMHSASPTAASAVSSTTAVRPPDPHMHSHGSHEAAKVTLNDVDIHNWHDFPPSYLAADFRLTNDSAIFGEVFDEDWDPENAAGHKGLMTAHVGAMCLAYFGALPIALALRAADHPAHYIANTGFLVVALLGWLAGVAYKSASVDRYEGSVHGGFGNILLLLSVALAALDSLGLIKRAIAFYRQPSRDWSVFVRDVLRTEKEHWAAAANRYEMVGLTEHEHDHEHGHEDEYDDRDEREHASHVVFALGDDEDEDEVPATQPRTLVSGSEHTKPRRPTLPMRQYSPASRTSTASEGTLHDTPSPSSSNGSFSHKPHGSRTGAYDQPAEAQEPLWQPRSERMNVRRFLEICLTWVRRTQVVIAYVVLLTGIAIYTGMCRGSYINGCAAHYIKGSIFFGYGVLTFARYLGAYADLGWAWNRRPSGSKACSAEMVECAVIFVYGITNTWMERFGAAPGDPYTVKQVQHISIAIMFWFAGLSGILLESKTVRRILGAVVAGGRKGVAEPPSYAFSFNPLPALVIAVTGLAMAAHHQDYVFQVEIHSLWGVLLAGGSVFRLLTYFFLWLRPPVESSLPSRPPTELLTSFGYAAGGIVFILSDEEIAFAAMRAGYDDMMAFLNFTIALTCLVFCWEVVVMAVKGVAVLRLGRKRDDEEQQVRA